MATIALRDYLSGIEELIDQGQTDEALAHSRHVLESYPKHIDTYRLMAKAYLEARRHSEASDIFQRVLSSVPDDFVAHIGMSIIREESGDQDAAIWHMERAFEAQPSNRAVQDELRRLYGKREGYAPPKVRLTRGALARMYAHGDLYNQAISELRSALGEDAERPDLQVLIAEMYFRTNRQTDAIDACSKLIEKYPYCLMANRIMAEILVNSNRQIEAHPYAERVGELDPYAMHTSGLAASSDAPADSVTIEQLIIAGAASAGNQPLPRAWTDALEMPDSSREHVKEDLPDWLSIDNFEDSADAPDETQPSETEPSVLGALESLGPKTGSLAAMEAAAPKDEERKTSDTQPAFISRSPSTALVDDQIPEWLRELRPATSSLSLPKEFQDPADAAAASEPEPERPTAPRWTEEFKTAGLDRSQLPPELDDEPSANEPAVDEATEQPKAEEDGLSWLESLAAESAAKDAAPPKTERETPTTPSWLTESETKPAPSQSKTDVLAWLDELKTDADARPAASESETKPHISEIEASAWEPELTQSEIKTEDSAPSWAEEIPGLEEPVLSQSSTSGERTVPAWLKDLSSEVEQVGGGKTGEISPRQLDEAPDWLNDLRQSEPEPAATEASIEEDEAEEETAVEPEETWQPSDDLSKLDWLEELAPKSPETSGDLDAENEVESAAVEELSAFETYKPVSDGLSGFELELEETAQAEPEPSVYQPAAYQPVDDFEPVAAEPVEAGARLRPKAATKRAASQADAEQRLEQARQALHYNKPEDAAIHYGYLLQRRQLLEEVVADLSAAVRRSPSDATLWQTLGDAYMRNNQLREALDSYRRAEDLL